MKPGRTTVSLIWFIVSMACDGPVRSSASMTKVENAKNAPATRALPSAAARVNPKIAGLIPRVLSAIPDPGGGRGGDVLVEVARVAAERALHAVGQALVAAVEDLAEEVVDEPHLVGGHPRPPELGREGVLRHGLEADVAARRLCDLGHRLAEGHQPRAGDLVEPAA